jgi:hypothetical protein
MSVTAAHKAEKTQGAIKMEISAKSATAAFTSLRSQTNAHIDAVVRIVFASVSHIARQAADSQRKDQADASMVRIAVEICMQHMHVHSRCQQIFRNNAKAHISEQQTAALQFLITEQRRGMRATHAVQGCWRSVLQRTMHKAAAAAACILSSQRHAGLHAACARALSNKCAAAVAISASHAAKARLGCIEAVRKLRRCHNSVATALSQLVGSASQADLQANDMLDAENPLTAGSVHYKRTGHTRARFSSAVDAKQMAKQLANINARSSKKRMSDNQFVTTKQVAARGFPTHQSPHPTRAASSKLQQSEPFSTSAREQDFSWGHSESASGSYSRFTEASASQRMFAQQATQMQEMQELHVVAEELSERLHTLLHRLRSRANSHEHG